MRRVSPIGVEITIQTKRANGSEAWTSLDPLERHGEILEEDDAGLLPGVTDFVHIGLVVEDLDETVRFLTLLGFDCGEPGVFGGEWIDRIIGLEEA